MTFATPSLTVRRLRATACGGDRLAARRDWERAFAAADAVPPELDAEGILLLRHVAWRTGRRELPGLRRLLSAARQRAVCPAEVSPAANADAVWFHDEAELLFCLARDWTTGALGGCWWWTVLGLASPGDVVQRWLAAPRATPAAIERLTRAGPAGEFLASLSLGEVRKLALAVGEAFALPLLGEGWEAAADLRKAPEPMPRRLRELVPETCPDMPAPALALWVASVLLVRHPAHARSLNVESTMREWLRPTAAPQPGDSGPAAVSTKSEAVVEPMTDARAALPARQAQPRAARPAGDTRIAALPTNQAHAAKTSESPPRPGDRADADEPADLARGRPRPQPRRSPAHVAADEGVRAPAVGLAAQWEPGLAAADALLRVRSDFGGVFYLLNVALDLGIYSDFTRPRAANLALSPFDWLAWLGGHWFGAEFEADPLAALLAQLSGRGPGEAVDFLAGVPNPAAATHEPSPPAGTSSCCICNTNLSHRFRSTDHGQRSDWLAREAQRAHERLVAGLPERFARELPGCVCRQSAEVRVAAQRVEVCFSLAAHPIELRLSGLDRNPGWLPAAGRAIYFRYD